MVTMHTKGYINKNDGVIIFVKLSLSHTIIEPHMPGSNCLLCKLDTVNFAIIALYRPPHNRCIDDFLVGLDNTLKSLSKYKNIVLVGDININIISSELNRHANEYLNLVALHGLSPTHYMPTRDKSCLDHILLKSDLKNTTLIFDTFITDHAPILINLELVSKLNSHNNFTTIRLDFPAVYKAISSMDLSMIIKNSDPNMATEMLVTTIKAVIQDNSTHSRVSSKLRIFKPWITKGLLRCIRNRDSMYRRLKCDPENYNLKVTYIRYRNFCNKLLKNIKHAYEKYEF